VFDIIGKRRWYFLLSALVTIPGLIFILLTPITAGAAGLHFTIDYTGGTKWEIRFKNQDVTPDQVVAVFAANALPASVVTTGDHFLEIKTAPIGLSAAPPSPTPVPTLVPSSSPGASGSVAPSASASAATSPNGSASPSASTRASAAPSASPTPSPSPSPSPTPSPSPSASPSPAAASASPGASPSASPVVATGNTQLPTDGRLGQMVVALEKSLGPIESQRSLTTIGPVVSSDLIQQALILIVVGSLGILAWITFRFHDVKFGVTALVALVHDVIVVVGTFAVLGTFFHVEIDALFVTAMLTVIGFSVHDTIVVFDRIRENRARHAGEPFAEVVNHSILQTFARSIMTSFTVVLTLLALLLFGGSAIRNFVLALLLGIISGTYSSIFNASPLLVVWQEWDDRRKGRAVSTRAPRARRAVS
jgi:preprotein translocase SecF subunit